MQIIWYGHSCFLIKTSIGKRILINPFDSSLGYNDDFPKCDVITISDSHFYSSHINASNISTRIINETGYFDINYLQIEGYNSFHDGFNGLKRGPNIIYIFRNSKYSICHLGHLGHIPSTMILDKLKNIDFLLVPIDGHFSLDGLEAAKLCKLVSPKYIIPMHYKTNKTALHLDDPKNFIMHMQYIRKFNSNILDISNLNYNTKCECILLSPP